MLPQEIIDIILIYVDDFHLVVKLNKQYAATKLFNINTWYLACYFSKLDIIKWQFEKNKKILWKSVRNDLERKDAKKTKANNFTIVKWICDRENDCIIKVILEAYGIDTKFTDFDYKTYINEDYPHFEFYLNIKINN